MPASLKHLTDKKLKLNSLLAKWKDGLYYTAAIVKCDKINKRCLICFEDGSEVWLKNRDIHLQLSLDNVDEDEDIVCCICDDGTSEEPNFIILCDVCQQGYHQQCHNPPVDSSKIDESEDSKDHKDWFCATCSYILNQSDSEKLAATAKKQPQYQNEWENPKKRQQSSPCEHQPRAKQAKLDIEPASPSSPAKSQQASLVSPKAGSSSASSSNSTSSSKSASTSTSQPLGHAQNKSAKTSPGLNNSPSTKSIKGPVSPAPRATPRYPLSDQVRAAVAAAAAATSSSPIASSISSTGGSASIAALASMAGGSTQLVGNSAGRTKQDLLNQSSQLQKRHMEAGLTSPLDQKHAVRKSSVNFSGPIKKSALPTATRSTLPAASPPAKSLAPSVVVSSTINASSPTVTNSVTTSIASKDSIKAVGRSSDTSRDRVVHQPTQASRSQIVTPPSSSETTMTVLQSRPRPTTTTTIHQSQDAQASPTPVQSHINQIKTPTSTTPILPIPNPVPHALGTWSVDPQVANIPLIPGSPPSLSPSQPITSALFMATLSNISKLSANSFAGHNGSGSQTNGSDNGTDHGSAVLYPSAKSVGESKPDNDNSKVSSFNEHVTASPEAAIRLHAANSQKSPAISNSPASSTSKEEKEHQQKVIVSSNPTKSA